MNQYKFRGISTVTKFWVYGSLLQREDSFGPISLIEVQHKFPHEPERVHVVAESVGIYFGWVDSEDKDIYTDDLLQITWPNGCVTCERISYSQEYGYFMYGNNPMCELTETSVISKVIGSIHDNVNPAGGQSSINTMNNFDPNEQKQQAEEVKAESQEVAAVEQEAQEKAMESEETEG